MPGRPHRHPLVALLGAVGLMALIALLAAAVDAAVPAISAVIVAIVLGIAVRNTIGLAPALRPAVALTSKRALQLGIILLGTGLSVAAVLQTGGQAFVAIVLSVLVTLATVAALARRFGVPRDLAVLIAAGTAICGATAIMALAPLVRARATEVSFAIAVITLFGTGAIAAYPLLGHALAMSEHAFGTWAGMAIHETAQVIAAAFQYGDAAGETATIVKLTRTTLLVPLAIGLAVVTARDERRRADRWHHSPMPGSDAWERKMAAVRSSLTSVDVIDEDAARSDRPKYARTRDPHALGATQALHTQPNRQHPVRTDRALGHTRTRRAMRGPAVVEAAWHGTHAEAVCGAVETPARLAKPLPNGRQTVSIDPRRHEPVAVLNGAVPSTCGRWLAVVDQTEDASRAAPATRPTADASEHSTATC